MSSSPLLSLGLVPYNRFVHRMKNLRWLANFLCFVRLPLKDPCLGIILVLTSLFLSGHLPRHGIIYTGAQFVFKF